jgi:hypothetical protein
MFCRWLQKKKIKTRPQLVIEALPFDCVKAPQGARLVPGRDPDHNPGRG